MLRRGFLFAFICAVFASFFVFPETVWSRHMGPADKAKWLPVPADDLALKDNPASPGAHAMILYREVVRDDFNRSEDDYVRIKIFDRAGMDYGNVQISSAQNVADIKEVHGRTIHPDGSIVDFNGKVYESTILKVGGFRRVAKTFAMPDIQPGSIVEYRYRREWSFLDLRGSHFVIQQELFTREVHFTTIASGPLTGISSSFHWVGIQLPREHSMHAIRGGFELEAKNIPGLAKEDFSPPDEELGARVDYFYTLGSTSTGDDFWKTTGINEDKYFEKFAAKKGEVKRAVDATVNPSDAPEMKLRKLYARAQQVRNLSDESEKSYKEVKAENLKPNENADDVLSHGYAIWFDIDWLFVAMVRQAGLTAGPAYVAKRDGAYFREEEANVSQLTGVVVVATVGPRTFYLDPGCSLCPFDLLPWNKTGAGGVRVEKQGGTLIRTPAPQAADASLERRANLRLGGDGRLDGALTLIYRGREALDWRLRFRGEDERGREKLLVDEIKSWLPEGSEIEVTSVAGIGDVEAPLQVEAKISQVDLGVKAGKRLLLPAGIFESRNANFFPHAERSSAVYFRYPYQQADSITIRVPESLEIASIPGAQHFLSHDFNYDFSSTQKEGEVHYERTIGVNQILFPVEQYPGVKAFFDLLRTHDTEEAVMETPAAGQ